MLFKQLLIVCSIQAIVYKFYVCFSRDSESGWYNSKSLACLFDLDHPGWLFFSISEYYSIPDFVLEHYFPSKFQCFFFVIFREFRSYIPLSVYEAAEHLNRSMDRRFLDCRLLFLAKVDKLLFPDIYLILNSPSFLGCHFLWPPRWHFIDLSPSDLKKKKKKKKKKRRYDIS